MQVWPCHHAGSYFVYFPFYSMKFLSSSQHLQPVVLPQLPGPSCQFSVEVVLAFDHRQECILHVCIWKVSSDWEKKKLFKKKSFFENSTRTFDEISNAFRSTKTVIDQNMQEVLLSTWTKWLDLKLCIVQVGDRKGTCCSTHLFGIL